MLNIVIPMAGRGSRFSAKGYSLPKPLIPVNGRPMIDVVVDNLRPSGQHRFIFICLQEHIERFGLVGHLENLSPGCRIVEVDRVTEGAACTVLLARELINNEIPLMIANSDQFVDIDIDQYLCDLDANALDGLIMTMWADDPKWSFVIFDEKGNVCEVVEKQVVSHEATVGIYNYRHGSDFVSAADRMIRKDLRVNNEFYVAPVYNEFVLDDKKIGVFNIGKVGDGMYGLGTPEDLDEFLAMHAPRLFAEMG